MTRLSTLAVLFVFCLLPTGRAAAQSMAGTWSEVAGPPGVKLKQLSAKSATELWGLDTAGFPWRWTGSSWEKKVCCVSSLSVASDGTLWATNPPDSLRVLKLDMANNKWTWNIPMGMKQVAAVDATTAWGLDKTGALFKLNGDKWEKKGCCVDQISASSDGMVMGASTSGETGISQWTGSSWMKLPGNNVFVSVGSGATIWALDSSGKALQWGTGWRDSGSVSLSNISVASDGSTWGLSSSGSIFRWAPAPVPPAPKPSKPSKPPSRPGRPF